MFRVAEVALFATIIVLCLSCSARADGRRLSINDVLSMETFGSAAFSPDGRWLVYERRGPYDEAPRFDRGHRSQWAVTELKVVDLRARSDARPLLPQEPGRGLLMGEWSPDGERLLIYRLRGMTLEAGVVAMDDRSVHWTGLTPDFPITGNGSAWLNDHQLVLTVRPDGELPWMLKFDGTGNKEMSERWGRTRDGRQPSRSVVDTSGGLLVTDAEPVLQSLVLLDCRTRKTHRLAVGAIRDIAASPNGRWIAILRSTEPTQHDPNASLVQSAVLNRSRLGILDVTTGREETPGSAIDVAPHLLRWSPESDQVLFWGLRDDSRSSAGSLWSMKADGSTHRFDHPGLDPLAPGSSVSELRGVRADWLAGFPILWARPAGGDRMDWWSARSADPKPLTAGFSAAPERLAAVEREAFMAFGDGELWRIDDAGARTRLSADAGFLTDGDPSSLMQPVRLRTGETPRRTWAPGRSGQRLSVIDRSGRVEVRSVPDACGGTVLSRATSERAIASICVFKGVETLRLATATSDRQIDEVNARFSGIDFAEPRPISHRDVKGRDVKSWLYLPPGVDQGQVKGLLVLVYPGGADDGRYIQATTLQMGLGHQLLVSQGYAVLSAALASETESARSNMIDDFNIGTDLAVDATLAAYPGLPADKMALMGHSFGGYTTLGVATRSNRFKTYVSWAGASDMFGRWGEFLPHGRIWPGEWFTLNQPMGAVEVGQAGLASPPWEAVADYVSASPYLMADQIEAPLLLISSDRDYVPLTQAERMLTAMHRQGRTARLVTYWGETHSNASPANIRDVYEQIFDWLDRTLGGEEVRRPTQAVAPTLLPNPRTQPSP